MKKYLVRFTTKNGEYDKEWCHANSASEAENIGILKALIWLKKSNDNN